MTNPFYRFGALAFAPALLGTLFLVVAVKAAAPVAWLAAISAVTFLTYGYDKAVAGSARVRVPEAVLLALALSGGTLGALAAMLLFRHKTAKSSFRLKFLGIVLVQGLLIAAYLWWTGTLKAPLPPRAQN